MASEVDLDNFEKRAAEAEGQIAALEKRLAAVESRATDSSSGDLGRVLDEVRRILAIVQEEEKAAKQVIAGTYSLRVDLFDECACDKLG